MACSASGCVAQAEGQWIEARTVNFLVRSNAGEKRAREIADEFERIRGVIHGALRRPDGAAPRDPRVPVTVLAAADETTFLDLLPHEWSRETVRRPPGLFFKTPERYYVVLRADLRGEQAYQLVYHEYFHVYAELNLPKLPLWLSEGLADFYAGTELRPNSVVRGGGMLRHKLLLRSAKLIPLRELFAADKVSPLYTDAQKASLFYAQSWALVHLLELGGAQSGSRAIGSAAELVQRISDAGSAPVHAGLEAAAVEQQLAAYVRRDNYPSLQLEQAGKREPAQASVRTLTKAEAEVALGEYYFAANRLNEAKRTIESVIREAPETPGAADLFGQWLLRRADPAGAWAEFSRAINLGSQDWRTYYLLAMLSAQRAATAEELAGAERLLRRAAELNPQSPEAASALAGMLLDGGRESDVALELARRASALEPESDAHLMLVARALAAKGNRAEARRAAESALALARSESARAAIQQYVQNLETVPQPAAPVYRSTVRELIRWAKDEAADEALRRWKAERDAVAHLQTFVSGRVLAVRCTAKPRLDLELETDAGTLKLRAADAGLVAYYIAQGTPPKVFDPCRMLRGKAVDIVYRPTPKGAAAGEILAIEMRD